VNEIEVDKDIANATLTVRTTFATPIERVWQLWADPRKLERWWGPPEWPATVVDHDLTPGGSVNYFMSGPDGQKSAGWWRVVSVEPPTVLEVEDGFAGDDGSPNLDLPVTRMRVELTSDGTTTVMVIASRYASAEALQQVLDMGMEEGMRAAMSQIDAVLAEA
jgi:uncharacterized protein YndB with AHSA1/START domain